MERVKANPSIIKESINPKLNKNIREILEKSLAYKAEDRVSVNGMKYLADVFMLHSTKKASSSSAMLANPPFQNKVSTESYLSPISIASPNIPARESFKKTEPEKNRGKFTSSIMYTQLPGKKMKENQKVTPMSSQFISAPSHPNIRMTPYSFNKSSQLSQIPNGFISFS